MRIVFVLLAVTLLYGCSHEKWVAKNQERICNSYCKESVESVNIRDTVVKFQHEFFMELDTSTMQMYFECDSMNQVLINKVEYLNGKRTTIKYILNDNTLLIKAQSDSIHQLIEINKVLSGIDSTKVIERRVPYEVTKREMIWWGWLLIGFLLALNIFQLIRNSLSKFKHD